MKEIKLADGTAIPDVLIKVLRASCEGMLETLPGTLALYELCELAKNPAHKVFSKEQVDTLVGLSLCSVKADGNIEVRSDVAAFIRNCVSFDEKTFTVKIVTPALD